MVVTFLENNLRFFYYLFRWILFAQQWGNMAFLRAGIAQKTTRGNGCCEIIPTREPIRLQSKV